MVKVTPKPSILLDHCSEVAPRRSNDPNIGCPGPVIAESSVHAVLEYTKETHLSLCWQIADLVEMDRSIFSHFQKPLPVLDCASVGALDMPEERAVNLAIGHTGNVKGHQLSRPSRHVVNCLGQQLLARAGLPTDEDGNGGGSQHGTGPGQRTRAVQRQQGREVEREDVVEGFFGLLGMEKPETASLNVSLIVAQPGDTCLVCDDGSRTSDRIPGIVEVCEQALVSRRHAEQHREEGPSRVAPCRPDLSSEVPPHMKHGLSLDRIIRKGLFETKAHVVSTSKKGPPMPSNAFTRTR